MLVNNCAHEIYTRTLILILSLIITNSPPLKPGQR